MRELRATVTVTPTDGRPSRAYEVVWSYDAVYVERWRDKIIAQMQRQLFTIMRDEGTLFGSTIGPFVLHEQEAS